MSEIVERVAKAMFAELDANGFGSYVDGGNDQTDVTLDGRFDLMAVARAAIAAMREPTEAMEKALINGVYGYGEAVTAYQGAIDEALK